MLSALDIIKAHNKIKHYLNETPIEHSRFYSRECDGNVYFKCEHQQITGAFKTRGALHALMNLKPEEKIRGITAVSAGNHALGIAYASEILGIDTTIILPKNASTAKIEALKHYNVNLEFFGKDYDEAEITARNLEKETGKPLISGYNNLNVIAGQGTIGVEILNQLPDVDIVITPVGGGGLLAGVSAFLKNLKPAMQVMGVQTDTSPVMHESFKAGKITAMEIRNTIADGLAGLIEPGAISFDIVKKYADDVLLVTEEETRKAVVNFLEKHHQVIEGSAAVIPAAFLKYRHLFKDKKAVGVLTGRNISFELLKTLLSL